MRMSRIACKKSDGKSNTNTSCNIGVNELTKMLPIAKSDLLCERMVFRSTVSRTGEDGNAGGDIGVQQNKIGTVRGGSAQSFPAMCMQKTIDIGLR